MDITPTENGTVMLEWQSDDKEFFIEIGNTRVKGFVKAGESTIFMDNMSEVISVLSLYGV